MDNINYKPIGDHVLVRPKQEEQKTKSGIVLPDASKEKPSEGTIVAVGKGKKTEYGKISSLEVIVGDEIIYSKYGGSEVKINNQDYIILSERDILLKKGLK
jgi:chaperonin GroES